MPHGTFIMVDGIDGSGKSTIVKNWKAHLTAEGNAIFDLKDYWLTRGTYPEYHELKSYDFIFSSEPSNVGVGKVIREELAKNGTGYPEQAIAEAFSIDRLILYKKIIIPALADGKCVIQDRGISTSLCYQALSGNISLKFLSSLPGNALALEHAPSDLVIVRIDAKTALGRLGKRSEKQDNVIFEKLDFQSKAADLFYSKEYAELFAAHGTTVHYLSSDDEIGIMQDKANKFLQTIISK